MPVLVALLVLVEGTADRVAETSSPVVSPTRDDPFVAAVSEAAGGVRGRRAGRTTPSRWPWGAGALGVLPLLATGSMLVAVLLRQHCRTTLWASPDQFTHACYSDIPALYGTAGLAGGAVPYLDAVGGEHLAQPVGTGFGLWLLSLVVPGGQDETRWAFDVAAVVVAVALVATVLAVAALARRRPWDAALVALSPAVLTGSLISLDLVAVALTVLGVLALARERPVLAGVLVGLALTTRPIAVVVLLALLLLAVRTGRWAAVGTTTAAALLTWLLADVPVLVLSGEGWRAYWSAAWSSPPGYGSLWLLPRLVGEEVGTAVAPVLPGWAGFAGVAVVVAAVLVVLLLPAGVRADLRPRHPWVWLPVAAVVVAAPFLIVRVAPALLDGASGLGIDGPVRWFAVVGYGLVLVGVGLFTLSTARRPRLPAVVLLLVVGVLITSPSMPVQAGLWVLPFAALAVPRWRDLLVWGSVEAAYATGTWFYLYGMSVENRGLPPWAYALLLLARVAALLWLAWRAVAVSRRPEDDVVRAPRAEDLLDDGRDDDPAAGDLEDAPDALVVSIGANGWTPRTL